MLAAAQARLAVALIEKVATASAVRCRSRCTPRTVATLSLAVVTTTDKPAAAREFAPVAAWLAGTSFTLHAGDMALPQFSASGCDSLMPVLDALGLDKVRRSATALQA